MEGIIALYIFMLAAIAGHVIISRVPVILHTPLMSGSNFIHGIVLIGAMVVLGHADTTLEKVIGFVAVLLGAGNAAGGYVVTERMLEMFKASGQRRAEEGLALMFSGNAARLLIDASYLLVATLFLLGLQRMGSPVTARSGIQWAGAGHADRDGGQLRLPRPAQLPADPRRHRRGHRGRVVVRQEGRDHRHAADGRAVQRHGRWLGGGDRRGGCCVRRQGARAACCSRWP